MLLTDKTRLTPGSLTPLGVSRRQTEILFLMAQGKSNSEIAGVCGISLLTVKKHAENIYQKLGVESRSAAISLALQSFSS